MIKVNTERTRRWEFEDSQTAEEVPEEEVIHTPDTPCMTHCIP